MRSRFEGSCPRCRVTTNRRVIIPTSELPPVKCTICGTQFYLRGTG